MTTTYTTTVTNLYTIPNPAGYVVNAIFEVTGTDGTHTASIGGNCQFTPTQGANIIPYDQLTQAEISQLEKQGSINIMVDSESIPLLINEVEIIAEDIPGWSVAVKNSLTVALDITVSPDLLMEGNARELVNRVQNIRKESNFELTDKILLEIEDNTALKDSIIQFSDYICREILAVQIDFLPVLKEGVEVDINDQKLRISVRKKG